MQRASILLAAATAMFLTAPGAAQDGKVRDFVDHVSPAFGEQVARFSEPVCPVSLGLPANFAEVIAGRVRAVARDAGIAFSRRADCRPNLIVVVAEDLDDLMARVRNSRPDLVSTLSQPDIRRLAEASSPVRAWHLTELRRPEGDRPDSGNTDMDRDVHLMHGMTGGFLRETNRRDILLSVVVLDLDAVDGLTLLQIADHAAMRGLAPIGEVEGLDAPSILSLFEDKAGGGAMARNATPLDIAFLRALYRVDPALDHRVQRNAVARLMERDLATRR